MRSKSGARPAGTAVVTGAAGTIGRLLVRELLAQGWHVLAVDVADAAPVEVGRAGSEHPRLTVVVADLTTRAGVDRVVGHVTAAARATDAAPGLDLLVHNAGVVVTTPFESVDPDELDREMSVNYGAPLRLTRALYPALARRGGQVVAVASLGALVPLAESPGYSASKAALRTFLAGLAQRTRDTGVRVAVVNPSAVDTAMLRHEATSGGSPLNFLGRPMPPERVVEAVMRAVTRRGTGLHERDVPAVEGRLLRLATAAPVTLVRALPWVAVLGRRGRRRYAERSQRPGGS